MLEEVGGWWAIWVMDNKAGTCCDGHWVFYVTGESLNSTPETNVILYGNQMDFK